MLIQGLKSFFFKSNYDFDSPDVNLFNFHPLFRVLFALHGIFFQNENSYWRFVFPVFSILHTLVAFGLEGMFMYHGYVIKDYAFATECFCYFLVVGTVPIILTSVLLNRKRILNLIDCMNNDFLYVCSLGPKYRNPFLRGQLTIWHLCILWFLFVVFITCIFNMSTFFYLLYQSLFENQTEFTTRPLMFPVWLPTVDAYRTPLYEIFIVYEAVAIFLVLYAFGGAIYLLFHILLHHYYLMDMMILDFNVIFDGLDETVTSLPKYDPRRVQVQTTLNKRIGRIVRWHITVFRSVDAVSFIYGPLIVYQVVFSSMGICLMAFQIAVSLDHGKIHFLFIMLCSATCLQLWISCYLGTIMRYKAFAVGDACWNCGWEDTSLGRLILQDILIVIMRAQQPVSIKFTGLPNLDLETFSSMMSKSYSYFNLLRQYQ